MTTSSRNRTIVLLSLTAVAIGFISCGGSGTDGSSQLGLGQVLVLASNPQYENLPTDDPMHHAFTLFATGTGTDTMSVLFDNTATSIPTEGGGTTSGKPMVVIFRRNGTTGSLSTSGTLATNVVTLPGPIQSYEFVQFSLTSTLSFDTGDSPYNKIVRGTAKYRLTAQGSASSAMPGEFDTGATLLDGGTVTLYPSADFIGSSNQ
ncbi:hypothetical protein [uncultured Akkermansia sp.]|uniref:hypothetical protein n=1 Tax=uncultured Akkermansia sp. TaxID=512294 RepID=UPI0026DCEB9E|nr:hypothetical protein [uncultured Akkermansia sp.]